MIFYFVASDRFVDTGFAVAFAASVVLDLVGRWDHTGWVKVGHGGNFGGFFCVGNHNVYT